MAATVRKKRFNGVKFNLFLDLAITIAFVVVMEVPFTGLHWHELVGVGMGVALLVHIIVHWRWIVSLTLNLFRKFFHETRVNYVLNWLVFVDLGVITVTGILISRTIGLHLGLSRDLMEVNQRLHILASNFSLILVGLHVGMHWKWIITYSRKYIFRNPFQRATAAAPALNSAQQSAGGNS